MPLVASFKPRESHLSYGISRLSLPFLLLRLFLPNRSGLVALPSETQRFNKITESTWSNLVNRKNDLRKHGKSAKYLLYNIQAPPPLHPLTRPAGQEKRRTEQNYSNSVRPDTEQKKKSYFYLFPTTEWINGASLYQCNSSLSFVHRPRNGNIHCSYNKRIFIFVSSYHTFVKLFICSRHLLVWQCLSVSKEVHDVNLR